jgi:hypothetical protein
VCQCNFNCTWLHMAIYTYTHNTGVYNHLYMVIYSHLLLYIALILTWLYTTIYTAFTFTCTTLFFGTWQFQLLFTSHFIVTCITKNLHTIDSYMQTTDFYMVIRGYLHLHSQSGLLFIPISHIRLCTYYVHTCFIWKSVLRNELRGYLNFA